ncbi:TetR/AcrR family transcriptional regulator [Pseudomonas sp. FME51]|uniref:TetR/AcrR family transcriptional regulator n=1 Tax=Pseudomonas sp. FME51 TaxID=2742609 RepID=UPI001866848B|nr:TetR/AcrR family transcriptional regulator [Pseudomonas sp. FME51]
MARSPKYSNISQRRKTALSDGGAKYKAKRDELIRVAADLFKEKGYQTTTLNDIASHAGMDRASVYYYVGNKEEFFRDAVKGGVEQNAEKVDQVLARKDISTQEKLEQLVQLLMKSYSDSYPYMYLYIQEEMHKIADAKTPWAQEMLEKTKGFERAVLALIKEGMAEGSFRDDIAATLAANTIFGMLNWTYRWYTPNSKYSAEEVADAFSKIFFTGLRSNK